MSHSTTTQSQPGTPLKRSRNFGIAYRDLAAHLLRRIHDRAVRRTQMALAPFAGNPATPNAVLLEDETRTALENAIVIGRIQGLELARQILASGLSDEEVNRKIFSKQRGLKAHRQLSAVWLTEEVSF